MYISERYYWRNSSMPSKDFSFSGNESDLAERLLQIIWDSTVNLFIVSLKKGYKENISSMSKRRVKKKSVSLFWVEHSRSDLTRGRFGCHCWTLTRYIFQILTPQHCQLQNSWQPSTPKPKTVVLRQTIWVKSADVPVEVPVVQLYRVFWAYHALIASLAK